MLVDNCTACEMNIRHNARFCHACGVPVWPLRICESCSLPTPARGSFCDQCGSQLETPVHESRVVPRASVEQSEAPLASPVRLVPSVSVDEPEVADNQFIIEPILKESPETPTDDMSSEKRVVTVLFADISGFTQISERLEPEEVSEIMNTVFDAMTDIIVENGGTIDKYIGDCVMALFGAPRSYGDDAERAVKAALLLQKELLNLSVRFEPIVGDKLEMRVGLNTGMVVAGFVGGQGHRNYTVMGDAVNLASRLETACERGRVLVASNTQRAISNCYVTDDAGAFNVKGKSKPVQAFYVVRERETNVSDLAAFFQGQPIPFLGRQAEMALLMDSMETVAARSSVHVVKVAGMLGSGKSRLVTEFSRLASENHQARIVYGRSTRSAGAFMAPVRLGLESYLKSEFDSVEDGIRQLLSSSLSVVVASANTISGPGLELLDCFFTGRDAFQAGGEEAQAVRKTLFWALGHLFRAIAAHNVCVLVIADAHLADETLREFVEYLLGDGGEKTKTLVCWEVQTGTENLENVRSLFETPKTGLLELKNLEDSAVGKMINDILSPVGEVPAWVVDWITAQAEGRPLYVLEHLRSLSALNLLVIDPELGTWEIVPERPDEMVLPPTIYGALQAELDAMDAAQRIILQRAAVVGRVFWGSLVTNICSGLLAEHKIERALQSLRVLGVLHRRGSTALEGTAEYRFQSELFQQVCYDSLVQKERKLIHGDVARSLSLVNLNLDPALMARHYRLADRPSHAIACLLVGLESCVKEYSIKDASHLLNEIEEILEESESSVGRRIANRSQRIRYCMSRAQVAHYLGELDDSMDAIDAGFELLEMPEQRVDETTEMLEGYASFLHSTRGRVYQTRGLPDQAVTAYREAYSRLSDAGASPAKRVDVQGSIAWNLLAAKKFDSAREICSSVLSQYENIEMGESAMADAVARHYDTVGRLAFIDKNFEEALRTYSQAKRLREIGGNIGLLAHSEGNLAGVSAMLGDWQGAAESFERVIQQWTTLGDVRMICIGQLNLSECLIELAATNEPGTAKKKRLKLAKALLQEAGVLLERLGSKDLIDIYDDLLGRLDS